MVDESLIGTGWRKRAVIIPLEYAWSSKINSSLDWMGASGLQRLGVWAEVKGHGSNCPWQAGLSFSSLMYPSPWNPSRFKRQKDSFTCFILPVPFPWDLNNTFRESSIFKGTRPSRKKKGTSCDHNFVKRPNTPLHTEFLFQLLDYLSLPPFDLFLLFIVCSVMASGGGEEHGETCTRDEVKVLDAYRSLGFFSFSLHLS